ncbi:MAG: sigma-70 family RNA polymerase sigma factor [Thermofilaceae archaeon]
MQKEEPFETDGRKEETQWLLWRGEALRWFLHHGVETELAEDLTQEALMRLLRCRKRQQTITHAYLHKVCQSVLYDHLRHCQREPLCIPMESCWRCALQEIGYESAENRLLLEQALARLSERERLVVILHYLQEQPYEAIAQCLGSGATTEGVKKACQRAIKKLQQWAQSR